VHPSCNSSTGSHLASSSSSSSSSPVVLSLSLSPHQQTSEVYHENPNTSLLGFLLVCCVMFLRCMLDKEDSSDASTPHPTHTTKKKRKKILTNLKFSAVAEDG
jgi:hypothetical protein